MNKPKHASGYSNQQTEYVRETCLYIATKLGDLMEELIVVGGLVPSLIVDQTALPEGVEPHVGTLDLDMGLQVSLLDTGRYRTLAKRLRVAGFELDRNDGGNPTRQRWTISEGAGKVTVDFLIPPLQKNHIGGKLFGIGSGLAAFIIPGLRCAFRDRKRIVLEGQTLLGEKAKREVWVCDAGAYVVLKALASSLRVKQKDAYDLFYVVHNYGRGIHDVADRLRPLLDDAEAQTAIQVLENDFTDPESKGPTRVAKFITGGPDASIQADVVGDISQLLKLCGDTQTR